MLWGVFRKVLDEKIVAQDKSQDQGGHDKVVKASPRTMERIEHASQKTNIQ